MIVKVDSGRGREYSARPVGRGAFMAGGPT